MAMRWTITAISLPLALVLTTCGPKQLTPDRAQALLQQGLVNDKKQASVSYAEVSPLLGAPMWEDIGALTAENIANSPPLQTIQRLLGSGDVVKTKSETPVQQLSGEYEGSVTQCNSIHLSLVMTEPPNFTGNYAVQSHYCWPRPPESAYHGGTIVGRISPLAQVEAHFQPALIDQFTRAQLAVSTAAGKLKLDGQVTGRGQWPMNVERVEPVGSLTAPITQFTYALSPAAQQLVTEPGQSISAGPYHVTSVEKLVLSTETEAVAEFGWEVTFNSLAAAIASQPSASGRGTATFRKQPDGEWILGEYEIADSP